MAPCYVRHHLPAVRGRPVGQADRDAHLPEDPRMPKPVPTPVAAALGLLPAALQGVRSLPGKVVQLPILAVSSALTTLDSTRRGYDDLAERGERLVARLRGVSFD